MTNSSSYSIIISVPISLTSCVTSHKTTELSLKYSLWHHCNDIYISPASLIFYLSMLASVFQCACNITNSSIVYLVRIWCGAKRVCTSFAAKYMAESSLHTMRIESGVNKLKIENCAVYVTLYWEMYVNRSKDLFKLFFSFSSKIYRTHREFQMTEMLH